LQPEHDAKAELNRRSQVCEILAGTGISRRESIPPRTKPGVSLVAVRKHLRPCEASANMPGSLGKLARRAEASAKTGRASGYCALYSGLEDRRVSFNTYARRQLACRVEARIGRVKARLRTLCFGAAALARASVASEGWNPVLELHQPLRLCRPPPELLGQRDLKPRCGRRKNLRPHCD